MLPLYEVPSYAVLVAAIALGVALTGVLHLASRRAFPKLKYDTHNTVGGIALGITGTLFAITLAFIVGIVWREYDDSAQRVATEVEAAGDAWHIAGELPNPGRDRIRGFLVTYAKVMIADEWPAMRRGARSRAADEELAGAFRTLREIRTRNPDESSAKTAVLQQVIALHDVRLRRLDDNRSGVTAFEWSILLFGALMTLGTLTMLGMPDRRVHVALTATVAATMAATFVLVFELDYPFRGDVAIAPAAWSELLSDSTMRP